MQARQQRNFVASMALDSASAQASLAMLERLERLESIAPLCRLPMGAERRPEPPL